MVTNIFGSHVQTISSALGQSEYFLGAIFPAHLTSLLPLTITILLLAVLTPLLCLPLLLGHHVLKLAPQRLDSPKLIPNLHQSAKIAFPNFQKVSSRSPQPPATKHNLMERVWVCLGGGVSNSQQSHPPSPDSTYSDSAAHAPYSTPPSANAHKNLRQPDFEKKFPSNQEKKNHLSIKNPPQGHTSPSCVCGNVAEGRNGKRMRTEWIGGKGGGGWDVEGN